MAKPKKRIASSKAKSKKPSPPKAKPKPKAQAKPKPKAQKKVSPKPKAKQATVNEVLTAAKRLRDPSARAARLERGIDEVSKPFHLVEPLIDALCESPMGFDEVGAHVIGLCRARPDDMGFLEKAGVELDTRTMSDAAETVLQMARAAGSSSSGAVVRLARLLCLRGDASGVPLLEEAIDDAPAWVFPREVLATYLAESEPARALTVLEDIPDDPRAKYAHELRATIFASLGQPQSAEAATAAALAAAKNKLLGRRQLSQWHYEANRYDRALLHARELLAARNAMTRNALAKLDDVDYVDEAIVQAYRLGGAFSELLPWVRARCADAVPASLAFHVFHGVTGIYPNPDPELARRAARANAEDFRKTDPSQMRAWRIHEASVSANAGDLTELETLARGDLDDDPAAWVELADAYISAGALDAASAAVDRALELDPHSSAALSTLFDLALSAGDGEALHRAADAMVLAKPTWHQGPEHLARSFARRGEVAPALEYSERAVRIAPYCQNAWIARGEALLVAGDLERARHAASRSRAIEAPTPGDDITILTSALAGELDSVELALAERYKLPALPFPAFIAKLRETAGRSR